MTMTPNRKHLAAATGTVAALLALTGCGGTTDVTKARVEAAVAPAFANLYVQQAAILGVPNVTTAGVAAQPTCDRGGPKVADKGPGADWICMIHFTDNAGAPQDGKFELQVKSNSCYTAAGPSKIVGLAVITDTNGNDVPNPVFEWDGCFDPNG
jgi:hypothetical protein